MGLIKTQTITQFYDANRTLQDFCLERNITKSTLNGYCVALKAYTLYTQMDLKSLLDEAYMEEDTRAPMRERQIKKHLIGFRSYLLKTEKAPRTVKGYFAKVKTFYSHHGVELPELPRFQIKNEYVANYDDIPRHEHIQQACNLVKGDFRSLILFMATSGTAQAEARSLTIQDFIDATKDYHHSVNLEEILNALEGRDDVVPTWYLRRIKTDKYYYTFNHPQATKEIIKYLKAQFHNTNIDVNRAIWPFLPALIGERFQRINDHFKWGRVGKYRFFRSHTLRKFHASNIGLPAEQIDALQGRSKNEVHETYIKTNPEELKKVYMGAMHRVEIKTGDGDMIDGVEILKKKEEIEKIGESRNNLKPVFDREKTKQCSGCNKIKPLNSFYKDSYQKDGYTHTCKDCMDSSKLNKAIELFETKIKPVLEKENKPFDINEIHQLINPDNKINYIQSLITLLNKNGYLYSWNDGRNKVYSLIPEQDYLRSKFNPENNAIVEIEEDEPLKKCPDCREILPISHFNETSTGYTTYCNICINIRNKEYRQSIKELNDEKAREERVRENKEKEIIEEGSFKKLILEDALDCCDNESITVHLRLLNKLEKAESK